MNCSQEQLNEFSLEHFTFINQIFGDGTVRLIISEVFNNENYEFSVEDVVSEELFEHGFHHILIDKNTKKTSYCSVDKSHQNMKINKNDTLCQSYTLLKYLGKPLDDIFANKKLNRTEKTLLVHDKMIKMYSEIISNEEFIEEFNKVNFYGSVDSSGKKMFRNYSKTYEKDSKKYQKGEPVALNLYNHQIIEQIKDVLQKWHNYGYFYFIGTGKCNGKKIVPLNEKINEINSKSAKSTKRSRSARSRSASARNRSVYARTRSASTRSPNI